MQASGVGIAQAKFVDILTDSKGTVQSLRGKANLAAFKIFNDNLQDPGNFVQQIKNDRQIPADIKDKVINSAKEAQIERFKYEVGGDKFRDRPETAKLAEKYANYLDGKISKDNLIVEIDQLKVSTPAKKSSIAFLSTIGLAQAQATNRAAVQPQATSSTKNSKIEEFKFAVGGKDHMNSQQTLQLAKLYERYFDGKLNLNEFKNEIDSLNVVGNAKFKAKQFVDPRSTSNSSNSSVSTTSAQNPNFLGDLNNLNAWISDELENYDNMPGSGISEMVTHFKAYFEANRVTDKKAQAKQIKEIISNCIDRVGLPKVSTDKDFIINQILNRIK